MRDPFFSPPSSLVTITQPLATSLSLPTLPFHIHEVLLSWAIYYALDSYVSPVLSRVMFPQTYNSLNLRTRINWNMRFAAFTQAVVISALALWVKYNDQEVASMNWKQRLWGYSGGIGMVQGFATGYFLWDLSVCIIHYKLLGPETLAHAVSALVMILLAFRPFMQHYGLNLILYELSTPFLNAHWFLDKFNMTGSQIQLYNGIVLVSSFVLSRLVWGSYNIIRMVLDLWSASRSGNVEADFAEARDWTFGVFGSTGKVSSIEPLPTWLVSIFIGGNVVLWTLNVYWLGQMVKAMRKRFTPVVDEKKLQ